MGPLKSPHAEEPLQTLTIDVFWHRLQGKAVYADSELLTAEQLTSALKEITGEKHGVAWSAFAAAFSHRVSRL